MSLWLSSILAIFFFIAGVVLIYIRIKTRKLAWTFAYIISFILCFACILYIIATFLLLGGIE